MNGGFASIIMLLALVYATTLLSILNEVELDSRIRASSQLLLSFIASIGVFSSMALIGRMRLRVLSLALFWIIVGVALVELLLPEQFVSQLYDAAYSWRPTGVYGAVNRDVAFWGFRRPLALTTEPAFVGTFLGLLVLVAYRARDATDRASALGSIAMLVMSFAIVRSPSLLLFIVPVLLGSKRTDWLIMGGALLVTVGIVWLGGISVAPSMLDGYLTGGSFFVRAIAPYATAVSVLGTYPLFGLGIGSEDEVLPLIIHVYSELGAWSNFHYFWGASAYNLITSNVAWLFISLGAVGSAAMIYLLVRVLRALRVSQMTTLILSVGIIWTSIGGFVDGRTWFVVFALAAASHNVRAGEASS